MRETTKEAEKFAAGNNSVKESNYITERFYKRSVSVRNKKIEER